ncbi:MAG: cell surface protein SprA [bacterium]|nr:cell surface protein SprA [bacterium]
MRANGIINFVLVTSATAFLMGVVTKAGKGSKLSRDDYDYYRPKNVLPPDTPETEDEAPDLPYNFKDNDGKTPLLDPKSKLYLENPENIKTEVKYDAKSGNYDVTQKMGTLDYRPETYMNLKEYKDYQFKKQMREYWRSRVAADELNKQPRKGMIPKLQVNSELFDRIFGGNTVDIKPTGTAELIFGLNRNKNLNPSIPQKQQKVTNFDFNMRIQLNLVGKIGDKLKVTTNYNTEASFNWENQVKVDYTGYEDEIIKKIEAGNVTLPLNSSLISGSQTLFGIKTQLQFGKLRTTSVFSQQNGKKTEITVQGGAQTQQFVLSADNYEQNKHYFLGHYFRNHYDAWMATLPVINTPIVITKVEVYLLGINGNAEQTRNVVAFEDLGEDTAAVWPGLKNPANFSNSAYAIMDQRGDSIPDNNSNSLYAIMTNSVNGLIAGRTFTDVANLATANFVTNSSNPNNVYMVEGRDFTKIQNARKLNPTDYTFNPRTGFISLNQQLNNDQALAVSYQYTHGAYTYQVGEFSEQVPDNSKILVCKLLKTNSVSVKHPMWKLMMKNVYAIGAYNLNPQDFKLDVFYNNIETGVDVPYLPSGAKTNGVQLIHVLKCDRLSVNGDKYSDGVFDFINGYTIAQSNGRVYFPTSEPFGRALEKEFDPVTEQADIKKYIFKELYDSTKTAASFMQEKNRFKIKGSYRSSSGSEIALNALNIPQGAVVVTANGVALMENTDYTVDYTLGRVKIINDGILNSGATIKVSLESNSLFSVQQKSLWGTRFDYAAGRNLSLGGTFLRYTERPMTAKVSMGDEPVSNIIAGLDYNYKADAPYLTRLVDKLPFFSTKEMSTISTRGEVAKLFPGNAKAISTNGGNSYVDDFEGSISLIDIKGASSWFLASVPQGLTSFPEGVLSNDIKVGLNRARFNWYNIDAMFTRDQNGTTPAYYSSKKLFSNNMWRQVFETELFPGKTPPNGQQIVLPLLDLGFFPSERGPYNYDVNPVPGISKGINNDGTLIAPASRWGGIMRKLETNDFQAANVEYVQFWLMDPFNEDYSSETDPAFDKSKLPKGDLFINLGNISEDIIKDDRMVYENGIPGGSDKLTIDSTKLADIPLQPPIVNAFSQNNEDRPLQDVGYDGLGNDKERFRFKQALADMNNGPFDAAVKATFQDDPSNDRYHFFRGDDYDELQANTIQRYSRYNNPEGNSPTESQYKNQNKEGYSTSATTLPNIEDINRDNTQSVTENYYQYHIHISPDDVSPQSVGSNFIVDAFDGTAVFSGVTKVVKWYQFKIPISQFESNVGGIEGFNSIRFMRVYMKGFDRPVLLRMARFELVRSDWRRYQFDLRQPGEIIATDNNSTSFDISAVSLLENSSKVPVNYVMPPQINQQQNVQTTNLVLLNEQALQMRVCDLKDGDSRAIFKNVELDTRMFGNMKMNVHAEKLNNIDLKDGDLTLFFRVGTDYNNNYYEYEVPLKLTPKGNYDPNSSSDRQIVWPADDEVNLKFSDVTEVKRLRNEKYGYFGELNQLSTPFPLSFGTYTLTIVGNPNLATIKSIMVGIRNPRGPDNQAHCAEVWINELRLTDFNNQGGWATTGQVQAKLADLGMLSLAGTYKSPFWGSVESKIGDRSKEYNTTWDMSSSINGGKFFPKTWKVTLPFFYNFGRTKITPLFNPLDPDVRMSELKKMPNDSLRKAIEDQTIDFTERKGFNFTNVRIDGFKRPKAKPMPWDVSNFSVTYAFNQIRRHSVNVQKNDNRQYRANLQYMYSLKAPPIFKPFTKTKIFQNKWFALIKDFNLQLLPNSFGASMDINRTYTELINRDITSFYAGSDFFAPIPLVNKNFTINRTYNFVWKFNNSIKFDYAANNDGRILESPGPVTPGDKAHRDEITHTFFNGTDSTGQGRFGETTVYRQQMNLNVDVPLSKFPALDFVKTTYRYGGTYTWNRRPFAADDNIGNTIQNTHAHVITGSMNLMQLYNKIPYLKKINNPVAKPGQLKAAGPGAGPADRKTSGPAPKDTSEKPNPFKEVFEFLARTLMMAKNVSLTYDLQGGQGMPNFVPHSQFLGMDFSQNQAPGYLFTTGLRDDQIREKSAANGWLAKIPQQTTPYTEMFKNTISYRASVEPHGSLKIEFNGNYSKTLNKTSYMLWKDTLTAEGIFSFNNSPNETGSFQISTFSNFNVFKDGKDPVNSTLFDDFLLSRYNMALDLQSKNGENSKGTQTYTNTAGKVITTVDGYSDNQQDVLLGTFNSIYADKSTKNYDTKNIFFKTPIPNWNITWDGLSKVPALKKTFRSITVTQAYRSTYNLNNFNNNILFNPDGVTQDRRMPVAVTSGSTELSRNFVPYYTLGSVTLRESFEPLVKFNFQFAKPGWSANVETKRDKTTSLNISGFQIIETKGQEYVVGLGYLYPKLRIKQLKIQGKVLESNLTVKVDMSYRKNISIIRQITDGVSIPTGGTNIITLRSSADYMLTPNITLRLFYDWVKTKPQTSASFPTSSISAGFSLRITFQ